MGRTDGKLIPFLKDALNTKKYLNLRWEEKDRRFMLDLPRQTSHLDSDYEKVLKDYYLYDGQPYKGYSKAKSVIKAAMDKSVYLRNLNKDKDKNKDLKKTIKTKMRYEFTGFRRQRKSRNKSGRLSPSVSSGYGSEGVPSPSAEEEDDLPVLHDEFLSFLNADDVKNQDPEFSEILEDLKACTGGDLKNPDGGMEGVQESVLFLQTTEFGSKVASDGPFKDTSVSILQTTEDACKIEDLANDAVPVEILNIVWICSEKFDVNSMQLLVFQPHQVTNGFTVPYEAVTVWDQGHTILVPARIFCNNQTRSFKMLSIENDHMIVLLK